MRRRRAAAAAIAAALALGAAGCGEEEAPDRRASQIDPLAHRDVLPYAGVALRADRLDDAGYAEAATVAFTAATPENELKWEVVHPEEDRYDFGPADRVVEFAARNTMLIRGHALVWHNQNPPWLFEGSPSREELVARLRSHIRTVMGRYRGRIAEWDVVNEAVDDDGGLRDTPWLRALGPSYVELAFRFAREADPRARLFYNDYGAEGEGPKRDGVLRLVRRLVRTGVPIDGVGFQGHVDTEPIPGWPGTLDAFAELQLDVVLTEVDVRLPDGHGTAEGLAQARQYRRLADGCVRLERCRGFVVWGVSDAESWVPEAYPGEGSATLLDEDLVPKPAYGEVRDALVRGR